MLHNHLKCLHISSNVYPFLMAEHLKFFFLAQNKSGLMTMLIKALLKKTPNCFYLFSEGEGRKAFTLNSKVLAIYTALVVTAG